MDVSESKMLFNPSELRLESQVETMKDSKGDLASKGPLFILISSGPEKCLEAVDESRATFWRRLLRLKVSFEGVPEPLKSSLENVAERLEHHVHSLGVEGAHGLAADAKDSLEIKRELDDWRRSEGEFRRLLSTLRSQPGFEDFLLPNSSQKLLRAAKDGPVVVVLGSDEIYVALIIRVEGVEALPLKSLSDAVIKSWSASLQLEAATTRSSLTTSTENVADETDRGFRPVGRKNQESRFHSALSGMWNQLVKPILDHLKLKPVQVPLVNPSLRIFVLTYLLLEHRGSTTAVVVPNGLVDQDSYSCCRNSVRLSQGSEGVRLHPLLLHPHSRNTS